MREELDKLLCERYPKIFRDRNAKESPMCWGFECGDGWYDLIDTLCSRLQTLTDNADAPQVVAGQVKEKFGGLRFYVGRASDEQHEFLKAAESESKKICETCGKPGKIVNLSGFYTARCDEHAKQSWSD